eukprot:CAMPEP_0175961934 /NCGR_PEP_ID=MMETSP0108-20121206/36203_1 /TAXON_ID=195067 ORGANISM="Goniomonas pacifica, Strain CCMP1869" /NCGR_SAMPLE_ID=MMETSP0108 /ASSEMBLY_ACC=CAM_ASM_000204 /LENGTH=66 /DNA_ID=CAMNT_0017289703 /DNA_START=14 /DNA_END=210 /DNA_ORIENTATION=+
MHSGLVHTPSNCTMFGWRSDLCTANSLMNFSRSRRARDEYSRLTATDAPRHVPSETLPAVPLAMSR